MQKLFYFVNEMPASTRFRIGASLPQGMFFVTQLLMLVDEALNPVTTRISPVQLWPDNSIKWVAFEGILERSFPEKAHCHLPSIQIPKFNRARIG